MTVFNTRDIGLAIRDHLEENRVTHFEADADGGLQEQGDAYVETVNVSDPSNLRVVLDNNEIFIVRITRA